MSGPEPTMSDHIAELRARQARAREMGGEEGLKRHRESGRLPVRERIEMLIDPEMVHLTRKFEQQDGRESSLGSKMRARMRAETPRPASHMERNSRFGRMLNASPCASPGGSRAASPCAFR